MRGYGKAKKCTAMALRCAASMGIAKALWSTVRNGKGKAALSLAACSYAMAERSQVEHSKGGACPRNALRRYGSARYRTAMALRRFDERGKGTA